MALLFVAAVMLPIGIGLHYHSLNAPSSDDWSYDLAVYHLAHHLHLDLYQWGAINLVGQLAMAVPVVWVFGDHAAPLAVWTSLIGWGGLTSVWYIGRRLGLSGNRALFAALLVGIGPIWAAVSGSFMTDVPAASFTALALAIASSDRQVTRLLTSRSALALGVAAVAFTIRDEAGVAFVAVAWCRLWRAGRPSPRLARDWVAVVVLVGAAMSDFYLWRIGLKSGGIAYHTTTQLKQWWYGQWLFPLLGLMLTPIVVLIGPMQTVKAAWRTCRTWTVLLWLLMPIGPTIGYVLSREEAVTHAGSLSGAIDQLAPHFGNAYFNFHGYIGPGRYFVSPSFSFCLGLIAGGTLMVVVACFAMGLHRWVNRDSTRHRTDQPGYVVRLLVVTSFGTLALFALTLQMNLEAWDRYLLPVAVFAGLVVLSEAEASVGAARDGWMSLRRLATGLSLAGIGGISVMATIAVDGYVGSEWSYSYQFAAAHRSVPPGLIFTNWTWTSTQNGLMTDGSATDDMVPGYSPCYVMEVQGGDGVPTTGLFARRGGSWVEPYTYEMTPAPTMATNPACHAGGARLSAGRVNGS